MRSWIHTEILMKHVLYFKDCAYASYISSETVIYVDLCSCSMLQHRKSFYHFLFLFFRRSRTPDLKFTPLSAGTWVEFPEERTSSDWQQSERPAHYLSRPKHWALFILSLDTTVFLGNEPTTNLKNAVIDGNENISFSVEIYQRYNYTSDRWKGMTRSFLDIWSDYEWLTHVGYFCSVVALFVWYTFVNVHLNVCLSLDGKLKWYAYLSKFWDMADNVWYKTTWLITSEQISSNFVWKIFQKQKR